MRPLPVSFGFLLLRSFSLSLSGGSKCYMIRGNPQQQHSSQSTDQDDTATMSHQGWVMLVRCKTCLTFSNLQYYLVLSQPVPSCLDKRNLPCRCFFFFFGVSLSLSWSPLVLRHCEFVSFHLLLSWTQPTPMHSFRLLLLCFRPCKSSSLSFSLCVCVCVRRCDLH